MVQKYLDELAAIVEKAIPETFSRTNLRFNHFFTGAAAYAYHKIFCTLGPKGLAVKVPLALRDELLHSKKGIELRYFENSPVKKDYVILSDAVTTDENEMNRLICLSLEHVLLSNEE